MTDYLVKLLWTFLAGAFAMGGWSTALEIRTQNNAAAIEKHDKKLNILEDQILKKLERIENKL